MYVQVTKVAERAAGVVVSGFFFSIAKLVEALMVLDRPTPVGELCDEHVQDSGGAPTFREYCTAAGTLLLYLIPSVVLLVPVLMLLLVPNIIERHAE